jgi:divalent metal cation (Fe/Co/Zn/Cd) transporter
MKNKLILFLSNLTFIAGISISLYAFVSLYFANKKLPSGVCPIDQKRPLLYLAIILIIVSLILSFFEKRKPKKTKSH